MNTRLVDLMSFVPAATRGFCRPEHLAPAVELFERAACEPVFAVISLPPRHGKTELVKASVAWRLRQDPACTVIYAAYGASFAEKISREMRTLFERVDGQLAEDARSRKDWRTPEGGGVWATSIDSSVTGVGGKLIVVDDPHKGRAEAESAIERDKVLEWFRSDLYTRREPGASIFVIQTRWHPEDLAGHLIAEGWRHVTLPALGADGRALWPERFDARSLAQIREQIGDYSWTSLYMQSPRPRGGAVFAGDVLFYDTLPTDAFRLGKGIDCAYSTRTHADRSAAVVLLEAEGVYYIVDVRRELMRVPEFMQLLAGLDQRWPGGWHWFASAQERGLGELASATAGVTVVPELATVDKFMRAQGVAAAWNAGKIRLPRTAPWLDAFVSEICGFTGVGDRHDDQVDAFASAFTSLAGHNMRALLERERAIVRAANRASPTQWAHRRPSAPVNAGLALRQQNAARLATAFTSYGGFVHGGGTGGYNPNELTMHDNLPPGMTLGPEHRVDGPRAAGGTGNGRKSGW